MDGMSWDHALQVTGDGEGLTGHAGAVLLRKLADRAHAWKLIAAAPASILDPDRPDDISLLMPTRLA